MTPPLAVVLKGYPRLSETFIAQELRGLEAQGIRFEIWSLRHPTDAQEHPVHAQILARRRYLPEYLHHEPLRVMRAVGSHLLSRAFWRAARIWVRDLLRSRDVNRIRRFGQAAVLARELPQGTRFVYAHFLHTPASVARYASLIRGLPWGASAHAKDIWTTPDWEKREKLADARFCVTCTRYGAEHLGALAPDTRRVGLVYHGLSLDDLPPPPEQASPDGPLRLLSVGRLVEKKGYDLLLRALSGLPRETDWRLVHIGGGEQKAELRAMADALQIADRIDWRGAQPRDAVFDAMRAADLFILPSRIAASGDRDGLPNVLMEAASQKLPVLSTKVSAIPEFIEDGISGTLAPPDDAQALGDAIERLAGAPEDRHLMAEALYERLLRDFGAEAGIRAVADRIAPYLATR